MPQAKDQKKQNKLALSVSLGVVAAGASMPLIMNALYRDNTDGPGYPTGVVAGALTIAASPGIGMLAAEAFELSMPVGEKIREYYKDFRNLSTTQQIILGLAAYNILVGTAVGGSFFVIANAAAREYLFDAALHFLNAYALNSGSKLIKGTALIGNVARMMQIDHVLGIGKSTIPKPLNIFDSINHLSTILGLFGTKLCGKSVDPAQPENAQPSSRPRNKL